MLVILATQIEIQDLNNAIVCFPKGTPVWYDYEEQVGYINGLHFMLYKNEVTILQ